MIHEKAMDKVQRHIDDAIQRGAQLLHGGKRIEGSGTFFAPTILADVPHDALVSQEETFGPLATLTRFETEEEVIKMANDTPVGLAGYFYSRDVGRVWRVAEALEVGMVGTNTGLISQAVIPFGGVKESGLGECVVCRRLSVVVLPRCHLAWVANGKAGKCSVLSIPTPDRAKPPIEVNTCTAHGVCDLTDLHFFCFPHVLTRH